MFIIPLVSDINQYTGTNRANWGSGSVAEWLARWTEAQKGLGSNRSRDAVG